MVSKNGFVFCFTSLVLFSCVTQQSTVPAKESISHEDSQNKAVEPLRNQVSLLYDFNALESLFDNQNWLQIEKKDSSYFYFSRVNPYLINTYDYRIKKGDSLNTIFSPIQSNPQGKIVWQWLHKNLELIGAAKSRAIWKCIDTDSFTIEMLKLDENEIRILFPDGKKWILQKTHPISLFLVRKQYDYLNGTSLAFDSIQFRKR